MYDGICCLTFGCTLLLVMRCGIHWVDYIMNTIVYSAFWHYYKMAYPLNSEKWVILNTSSVYEFKHKSLSGKNAWKLFKPSALYCCCEWHQVCTACFLVSPLGLPLSSHIRRPVMRSQMIRWLYLAMVVAVCSSRCQVSCSTFGSKDGTRCHIHNSLMLMAQCGRIRRVFIFFSLVSQCSCYSRLRYLSDV